MKMKFSKLHEDAKIPSKREEDAGYDLYVCFDADFIKIKPHEIKMIPTGLACAFDKEYIMLLRERGSTGSKGLSLRCGIIDAGFRDEIFVALNNTTNSDIIIVKKDYVDSLEIANENCVIYPYEKAVAQFVMLPALHFDIDEISYDELKNIKSDRGLGKLGSTNK